MEKKGQHISRHGLETHGLTAVSTAHWNLSAPPLYEAGLRRGEGVLSIDGAFVTETGEYTGRSPRDKFMVEEPSSGMRGGGIALVVVGSVMTAVGLFGGIISFVAIEGDSSAIVGGALLGGGIGLGVTGIVTGSLMIKGAKADYNLDIPGHQERAAALPRSSHPALTLTW